MKKCSLWDGPEHRSTALLIFCIAFAIKIFGMWLAIHLFPGPFDWQYRVMSGLASQVDNPTGYWAFCWGISLSFALVFCLAGYLQNRVGERPAKTSAFLFRVGAVGGFLVGMERGVIHNISSLFYKSHEVIAFIAFFGVFLGISGFSLRWIKTQWKMGKRLNPLIVGLAICGPFACAALAQLTVYIQFRHLGWVSPYWKELGVPVYLSFAFWQWIASFGAFVSTGMLCYLAPEKPTTSQS